MSTVKIGKLTEVDVRDLWKHEQYDFSNWLAKEENIKLLDDEIGLTLMDINKEVYIGSYRCDLVAKDETTGQIVIVAGYDGPMESFLQSNPGLKSRFNEYIHFDDYSKEELFMIFGLLCEQNDFRMDIEAQDTLKSYLNDLCNHKPDNFANGREMRNLFDKSKKAHSNRLASLNKISDKDLITFKKDDVLKAIEEMKSV